VTIGDDIGTALKWLAIGIFVGGVVLGGVVAWIVMWII